MLEPTEIILDKKWRRRLSAAVEEALLKMVSASKHI